ncbi:hypothetical protein [Roseibium sp.]|uniref:hypothetical protein n=1 Tax=Roseibium sp. TaxID=1936156 RepID=UPI003BACCD20
MTETVEIQAANTDWAEAANGLANVMIATNGRDAVKVHVGASEPGPDGAAVEVDRNTPLTLSNLTGTDKVYVRGVVNDAAVIVIRG